MNWIKIAIFRSRVWARYRRAKRAYIKLAASHANEEKAWKAERTRLVNFYEKQLATERKQFQLLHTEWANRFLQSQKLMSLSIATANLDEAVKPHLLENYDTPKTKDTVSMLTPEQYSYFSDVQKAFWEDGKAEGKSEAEIQAYWDAKESEILGQVRQEILTHGESTDTAS